MADFDAAEALKAAANVFRVADPEKILVERYFDEGFFNLESEAVWGRSWQMACRLEQIPQVGDWIEYTILGKSVIVVRAKDGVKAFHNHCRHRGVPIAGGHGNDRGNCAKTGFICPFHGWRWNMEGECTFVYGRHLFNQDLLAREDLALRAVRCETWGGFAFISLDEDALPFVDTMGPILEALDARHIGQLRAEWWYGTVIPANWKVAMEAFQEGYHVMKTHPQLQHASPALYNARYGNDTGGQGPLINPDMSVRDNIAAQLDHMRLLSAGMAGLVHAKELAIAESLADVELPSGPLEAIPMWYGIVQDQITSCLRASGEDAPDLNAVAVSHPVEALQFLFPNMFVLNFFTSMTTYRIRPLTPETCLFEIWSLTGFPAGQEPAVVQEPVILPFDSKDFPQIPQQDYSNIPIQQRGLHSQGFSFMRLSREREGLISNYHRTIDALIEGKPRGKVAAAIGKLAWNFDGPILDLDF